MDLIWPQSTNFGIFYLLLIHLHQKNLIFGLNCTYKIFRKVMAGLPPRHCTWSVKLMPPILSESKFTSSFCFPFKVPDDPTATSYYVHKCSAVARNFYILNYSFLSNNCSAVCITKQAKIEFWRLSDLWRFKTR